jgi:signal transduction histidine kinase
MKPNSDVRSFFSLRRLALSAKLCLGLALVAAVGLGIGALTLDRAIRPAFAELERDAVGQQIARTEALLQTSLSTVENSATDYAVWDDSYAYVATRNHAFEQQNLTVLGLVNLGINAIAYARFDGELLGALYVDLETEEAVSEAAGPLGALVTSTRFRELAREQASFSEFVRLNGRVYAVAAAQVFRSDGSGAPAGYVVMGRELTDAFVTDALQTPSTITSAIDTETTMLDEAWQVVVPISNASGERIASLHYQVDRDTSKLGAVSIASALAASSAVMIGVLLAVLLLMRILVVRRLQTVTSHVRRVAGDGVLTPLAPDRAGDELGSLNRSFNAMIAQLHELREQVKEQSFLLGQSDLAASVIHNVRNSLNPVSVIIAQTLAEKPPIAEADVARALRELKSSDTPPERRERLAAFLLDGLGEWERRAALRHDALLTAKSALGEALEILRSQSEAANREIPIERFDALELIKRNAAISRFAPWDEVVIDLPDAGADIIANRLLLSQVLANLMTNALESIVAGEARPGHVSIALARQPSSDKNWVRITIADDGRGFDPSAAAKLFERGHSSKSSSGGLGLHWCANTVRAMGGSLELESDGVGKGARAIISLPADAQRTATANDARTVAA